MQPGRIAIGPEPTQQIPQNQQRQPAAGPHQRARSNVVFVAANLTDDRLDAEGPRAAQGRTTPKLWSPTATARLQAALPTGVYTISAAGIPGAAGGKLVVGSYRSSSQNDVLLP